jgi:acetolactate synthase-1/2/3 large subunit
MMTGNHEQSGAEVLADMLAAYDVSHIFMVPAVLRHTFAEIERRHPRIQRVVTHGEKSAAYMADGYARASGKPGVCAAQVVGALNLAAGLRDAWLAHSPVIAMTGGRLPATKFKNVYQEIDDVPAFEPVTKFNATIDDVSRIPDMVRQAFRVATSGAPGPVHLQFQGNEGQIDNDSAPMEALVEPQFAQVPPYRPAPADDAVRAALAAIADAARPIIVAGGGVRASGGGAALMGLADRLAVPVATTATARDVAPSSHPRSVGVVGTYSRESANRAVSRADLVVFVGTTAGSMPTHFWSIPQPGTRVVQIDIDPETIGRNYSVIVGVLGDARTTLEAMLTAVCDTPTPDRSAWLAEIDGFRDDWQSTYAQVMSSDEVPMRPERLARELTSFLPADSIVAVDTGHAGMWMAQFLDLTSPEQSYMRSAGHLGWAFPAGLGAKCAQPDRPTFVFTGDAGFYYHLGELETAVRRNISTIIVVNNNVGGTQSKRGFDRAYGGEATPQAKEMWTYVDADFVRIAEAVGATGIRVDKPAHLNGALERAVAAHGPVVLDVRTAPDAIAPLAFAP